MIYRKNNYVYSIRINKNERNMLKKNESIKRDLDKIVRDYLKHFVIENTGK